MVVNCKSKLVALPAKHVFADEIWDFEKAVRKWHKYRNRRWPLREWSRHPFSKRCRSWFDCFCGVVVDTWGSKWLFVVLLNIWLLVLEKMTWFFVGVLTILLKIHVLCRKCINYAFFDFLAIRKFLACFPPFLYTFATFISYVPIIPPASRCPQQLSMFLAKIHQPHLLGYIAPSRQNRRIQ